MSAVEVPPSQVQIASRSGRTSKFADGTIALGGGTFLMGTNFANAFPLDGEGPVREITLNPFQMDRYPVTNERFGRFVAAAG